MIDLSVMPALQPRIGLLFRIKARSLRNRVEQAITEAPVRVTTAVILIAIIWLGLYKLFYEVFAQLRRTPLEATVAIPMVFNFFFVAMLVLLTFSNAIIAYGALFGKDESAYLLTAPLTTTDVVTLKYSETIFMASWSLVLLGFPLMMSLAEWAENRAFYLLFLAFFLAFIPIPGSLGMVLAWGAARFLPANLMKRLAVLLGLVTGAFLLLSIRSLRFGDAETGEWLRAFQARMNIMESALLPNRWVSAGIDHAMNARIPDALLYLGVTAANGLFLSWLAVILVAGRFDAALDRAMAHRGSGRRDASPASGGFSGTVFFYLPHPLRLIAAKDLRTFFRDPLQWSQLAILFGLLALYLTNMPTLRAQLSGWGWYLIIPFLNLCAVGLILATFTCRFVFPLVSLEGRKLWLIGLLPLPRGSVLYAKFAFAMTVTLLVALGTMILAVFILRLTPAWTAIHLTVTVAMCYGLCGLSVGIGARLPMFGETNPARIANGFGGTANLLASVLLVTAMLISVGYATWLCRHLPEDAAPGVLPVALCAAAVLLSVAVGSTAMHLGKRHFNRVEV